MDRTEIPVYGHQGSGALTTPLRAHLLPSAAVFNGDGDCLAAKLRPGNVASADGWKKLLLPEIDRQQVRTRSMHMSKMRMSAWLVLAAAFAVAFSWRLHFHQAYMNIEWPHFRTLDQFAPPASMPMHLKSVSQWGFESRALSPWRVFYWLCGPGCRDEFRAACPSGNRCVGWMDAGPRAGDELFSGDDVRGGLAEFVIGCICISKRGI